MKLAIPTAKIDSIALWKLLAEFVRASLSNCIPGGLSGLW